MKEMGVKERLIKLKEETWDNAVNCIMPFWQRYAIDKENGGFYGAVYENLKPAVNEPKSAVLMTRILWSFSNAYDKTSERKYQESAKCAYDYLKDYFWDKTYGGVYWMVGPNGAPFDMVKRTYAQASFLYALAEYYDVFHVEEACEYIKKMVHIMTTKVRGENGGYRDSSSRDWNEDPWLNLWSMNGGGAPLLLNSHLHLLESYILIYRSTKDKKALDAMRQMLQFLLDNCVEYDTGHLKAGMDINCNRIDTEISYGHDLECAYLIMEASYLIGESDLIQKSKSIVLMLAEHAIDEGMDPIDGSMNLEKNCETGNNIRTKVWWVECEAITGLLCAYELSYNIRFLDAVFSIWEYVKKYMVYEDGLEWRGIGRHVKSDSQTEDVDAAMGKLLGPTRANKTKCPYHNSRMTFGASERVERILASL